MPIRHASPGATQSGLLRLSRPTRPATRRHPVVARAAGPLGGGPAAPAAPVTTTTTVRLDASALARDAGPPRLASQLAAFDAPIPLAGRPSLPLCVYLPGIDGTGLAAARQFPSLLTRFDLVTLITPPDDRTDFAGIVVIVAAFLREEVPRHAPTRPVYLLGESFGGLLALAVAAEVPALVDRLVLVNPATSFQDTLWPLAGPALARIPAAAYGALPIALAPVLGNPVNLLAAALDGVGEGAGLGERAAALVAGAAQLLAQLPLLADLLPPETLAHKLGLLQEGCAAVAPKLSDVPQRVLLVVGDEDRLIPSATEGPRLRRALPRAHLRVEKGRSHALLQEGGVDLIQIMDEEGALVARRRLSSPPASRGRGAAGFGSAEPIELPTERELARYGERTTALGRRLSSPIFLSTSPDGAVARGLGNVPSPGQGPLLFVGNHQTLALDLGVLCEEFLRERGIMLRGLAHPVIFNSFKAQTGGSSGSEEAQKPQNGGKQQLSPFDVIPAFGQMLGGGGGGGGGGNDARATDGRQAFADFMTEFGAVPVSGRNFVRLLSNGEAVLLFPGGVREAYRRKGEEYRLFWPKRAEFVRMAAKYGATIVPFAAVGVDDSLEILLDADEIAATPVLGSLVSARATSLPQARRGVAAGEDEEPESFVAPLAVPKLPPRRMYFLFGAPIDTGPEMLEERSQCEELYRRVKGEVEGGLQYLLERRKEDPYEEFGRRVLWEAARGGRQQAPTFPLV